MKSKIPSDAHEVFSTSLFSVYTKEVKQFDGSLKTFERIRAYDIAKALCVVEDKIIILHTEMPGGLSFMSIPGGIIDAGENPDEAIRRETREETGIEFGTFERIATAHSNIGLIEAYKYLYIVRDPVSFGEQHLDPGGEKLKLEYITFDEMIEYIKRDEVFREIGNRILREYILPGKEEDLRKILFG